MNKSSQLQGSGSSVLTIPVDNRTELRLLELSHAPSLFRLVTSNRDHLRPWLPWVDRMLVQTDAENYIRRSLGRFSAGMEAHFGIWFDRDLAGSITVERIDAWNRVAEIGYWLGKEFVGRGIMRRSAAALIDYLIDKRSINRIEIRCTTANVRSRSIPLHLGFRLEGTMHQAAYLQGRFHDHLLFAITADEWKRRKRGGRLMLPEPALWPGICPHDKDRTADKSREPEAGSDFSSRPRAVASRSAKNRFLSILCQQSGFRLRFCEEPGSQETARQHQTPDFPV